MTTKETAYQTLTALVERFDEQKASYKRSDYNETLARRDFIDPFFKALGVRADETDHPWPEQTDHPFCWRREGVHACVGGD